MSRDPDEVLSDLRDMLSELDNDDKWLDDEEDDSDDDTPQLDQPGEGIEWDDDDDEDC